MVSTPETAPTQPDDKLLDAGVVSPKQQIRILQRKLLISNQVVALLAAENRALKSQERRAAA